MNLKALLIVIAVLAVASAAVFFSQQSGSSARAATADERVGQPVLPPTIAEKATRVTLANNGQSVELVRNEDGTWTVTNYHELPADFAKLARLVRDLSTTDVERFVTTNPERIARLDFGETRVTLADADGTSLWSLALGRTAEGGGRFLRFDDDSPVYFARLSLALDATPRNWADTALVDLNAEDIARIELTFPNSDDVLIATRPDDSTPFSAENPPDGQRLRSGAVAALLPTLTNLRFTDTTAPDDADAVAARDNARTVKLTTFDGSTTTIALGRRPERTTINAPESSGPAALGSISEAAGDTPPASAEAEDLQPTTETIPTGPVFAVVTRSGNDPRNAFADRRAFKVSDYAFTSLPADRTGLFEPEP